MRISRARRPLWRATPGERDHEQARSSRRPAWLLAKRLGEKIDGARLHALHRHRNVAVTTHEDDRKSDAKLVELRLEIQTTGAGKAHVKNEATRRVRPGRFQEGVDG